jgi:hypothetical protein
VMNGGKFSAIIEAEAPTPIGALLERMHVCALV